MSGHSKWSQIKRKKGLADSKRGREFSKLVKEISVAARIGGNDPDMNPRLRTAITKAKEINMPHDNIKRAIQKGTTEIGGAAYEEVVYEGYGPGGTAIYLDVLTDNKNRTVGEIRHVLSKSGGSLGESGCVSWMFEKKGLIQVAKKSIDEDSLMNIILDAGALDLVNDPDTENYEVYTTPANVHEIKSAIEDTKVATISTEITMIPKNSIMLEDNVAGQMLRLMEALEDIEDIQNVYSNFDLTKEAMASA